MILQALTQYYEDLADQGRIARPGWAKAKISYALCLSPEGELVQVIPLLEDRGGKKPQPQQMELPAPVKRTVGIAPNFLWDNSAYLLGIDGKGKAGQEQKKPERSRECFEAARQLHHRLLDGVPGVSAGSILRFFDRWEPENAQTHPVLQSEYDAVVSGVNLTFFTDNMFARDDPLIRQGWQAFYERSEGGAVRQCLITGTEGAAEATHPAIKGVDGAQSSGAALVSFNAPAFCSYGQEQNYNAPVGKYAAFAYTSALNHLLADRENVQKIGDTTVVCWAKSAEQQYQAFTFAALFGKQDEEMSENDLRDALRKLAEGRPVPERKLDPKQPFYILGLSPNAARLSVRFFYRDTFGNLMKNVNAHHERMEIVHGPKDFGMLPLWAMLRETVNMNSRDKTPSPVMAGAAARAVFTGGQYPAALLENTMLRIRAEREVTRGRAAIIKAYYLRNENPFCPKEVLTVALNEASTNIPYTLGRLFSVYESVQQAANPGINTTIRDKYYNAAASTPATIFPILDNLCQKHLRKLDVKLRIWYENQIYAIVGVLGEEYPARLNLPQQGSFNLGYYHQTQKRYEPKAAG